MWAILLAVLEYTELFCAIVCTHPEYIEMKPLLGGVMMVLQVYSM